MHCCYVEPGYNICAGLPADRWKELKADAEELCASWTLVQSEIFTMPASRFEHKAASYLDGYCRNLSKALLDPEQPAIKFDKENEHGVGRVVFSCSANNMPEKMMVYQAFVRLLLRRAHARGHNLNIYSA